MRTTNYDAIATSAPINKQAALMRDGRGPDDQIAMPEFTDHWDAPPRQERLPPRDLPRLEGRIFGAGMRVVRYHTARSNGARWLVRCSCGAYELRNTSAILTCQADHACQACNHLQHIRWAADRSNQPDAREKALKPTFRVKFTRDQMLTLQRLATSAGEAEIVEKLASRLSGLGAA